MKSKPGIYFLKNKIDGKVYIGQSVSVSSRVWHHLKLLKNGNHFNRHLQSSFKMYGKENFEWGEIEYCEREFLNEREVFYIKKFNSTDDRFGFNFQLGGDTQREPTEKMKSYLRSMRESKPVFGFTVLGVFKKKWPSISACAIELKASPCDVRRTISQHQRFCKGYVLNSEKVFRIRKSKRGAHLNNNTTFVRI